MKLSELGYATQLSEEATRISGILKLLRIGAPITWTIGEGDAAMAYIADQDERHFLITGLEDRNTSIVKELKALGITIE